MPLPEEASHTPAKPESSGACVCVEGGGVASLQPWHPVQMLTMNQLMGRDTPA